LIFSNFRFVVFELPLKFPHERDNWNMLVFVKMNFTDVKLVRLNCVQCNQSVVFYSDVLDASGNALDR